MMKLKFLFDQRALAMMLLKNWEYDEDCLDLMDQFRISANAVYPFRCNGQLQLLRFAPVSEKKEKNIQAEIDFIKYLINENYPAHIPIQSKEGKDLILNSTPWGDYYACVFKGVKGKKSIDYIVDDNTAVAFGQKLGLLHRLSSKYYVTKKERWSHQNVFNWIEQELMILTNEDGALNELSELKKEFSAIPIGRNNYGIIHYDFEPDNIFYDVESKSCSVIDFDDAMYHWYVMDIERSLNSFEVEMKKSDFVKIKKNFLEGYKSVYSINKQDFNKINLFKRFANLYGYTRIKRSINESWQNEPDWMINLRKKLEYQLDFIGSSFNP